MRGRARCRREAAADEEQGAKGEVKGCTRYLLVACCPLLVARCLVRRALFAVLLLSRVDGLLWKKNALAATATHSRCCCCCAAFSCPLPFSGAGSEWWMVVSEREKAEIGDRSRHKTTLCHSTLAGD